MNAGRRLGFTLIEVMVAVAILGLGLASLFTSQVGAIKVAQRARATTVATLLARCKMGEIEERILTEGLPYNDINEDDECCEDLEREGFECEWSVKRIVLPDQMMEDEEGGDGLLDALGGGADDEGDGDQTDLSKLDPNNLSSEDMTSMMATGMGGGILDMITTMTFPIMKPLIEEQVRRATVTVSWFEGDQEHNFDVVQFLVSAQGAPPPDTGDGTTGGTTGGVNTGTGNTGTGNTGQNTGSATAGVR